MVSVVHVSVVQSHVGLVVLVTSTVVLLDVVAVQSGVVVSVVHGSVVLVPLTVVLVDVEAVQYGVVVSVVHVFLLSFIPMTPKF